MRRNIQIVGWTLIWSGILVLGYVGFELIGTDLLNARTQAAAEEQLAENFSEARQDPALAEKIDTGLSPGEGPEAVEFHPEEIPEADTGFAVIRIPRLGVEEVVFEGVARDTLRKGPGHIPGTALPGQPGNAVISGHRTTYGRAFFDLDLLQPGDRIEIETSIGTHVYELREEPFVVEPTDVWVTDDKPGGWLTLTTCEPKFSARKRLIVTAELVEGPNLDYIRLLEGRITELS